MKVILDPSNNSIHISGFFIDVFQAVVKVLPYALRYQFVAFATPNGEMAGTYDELISELYHGVLSFPHTHFFLSFLTFLIEMN